MAKTKKTKTEADAAAATTPEMTEEARLTLAATTGFYEDGTPVEYAVDDVSEWILPHKDWVDPIPGRVYTFEHPNADNCKGLSFIFVESLIRKDENGKDEMEDIENDDGDKIGEEVVERFKYFKLQPSTNSDGENFTYWEIRKRHALYMELVTEGSVHTTPKAAEPT